VARLDGAGIPHGVVGAALARNNFRLPEAAQRTVQDFLQKPAERAVLLAPEHRWVGAGVASAGDVRYFVLILGMPPTEATAPDQPMT
jgi:hypothetical protein